MILGNGGLGARALPQPLAVGFGTAANGSAVNLGIDRVLEVSRRSTHQNVPAACGSMGGMDANERLLLDASV